jgi:hypothetical protein
LPHEVTLRFTIPVFEPVGTFGSRIFQPLAKPARFELAPARISNGGLFFHRSNASLHHTGIQAHCNAEIRHTSTALLHICASAFARRLGRQFNFENVKVCAQPAVRPEAALAWQSNTPAHTLKTL